MPNSQQATRRVKKANRSNERKRPLRSELKTIYKNLLRLIENKDSNAREYFKLMQKRLAQFAGKGLISKNTASRTTSRLNARLKKAAL